MLADLAWWYGWQPSELDEFTLDEIEQWFTQAKRQIDAKYTKAT